MNTTLQSPTSNEKKSLTSVKDVSRRGVDAQCPTYPSRQTVVQAKLELTTPGDNYEQEADRMADHVMRSAFSVSDGAGQKPQRTMSRPIVSRRSSGSGGVVVDSQTESGIMSSRGGGSSLPTALRSRMESGFGADFSNVRIHNDAKAASLSNAIQAKAFTYGNDIYFNRGQYSPFSSDGQRLIAHELTHTLQQMGIVGRETDGGQEKQINDYKEFTLEELLKIDTNDPELDPGLLRVIISARQFLQYGAMELALAKNMKVSYPFDQEDALKLFPDFVRNIKVKYFLSFIDSKTNRTGLYESRSIPKSDIQAFLDYADLVSNGIEDKDDVFPSMREKNLNNLANGRRKDGKGITIAIMTDKDSDSSGSYFKKDPNVNYEDIDPYYRLYCNNDYYFLLQGLNSLDEYAEKMELLVNLFGPLQNLIISGHGEWDRIKLDENLLLVTSDGAERFYYDGNLNSDRGRQVGKFEQEKADTISFFQKVNSLMSKSRNTTNLIQSIYLDACSTNETHIGQLNFKETMLKYVHDVQIWANSAASDQNQRASYDSEDGGLVIINDTDPTILNDHDSYTGNDYFSRARGLGNIIHNFTYNDDFDSKMSIIKDFHSRLDLFISEIRSVQNDKLGKSIKSLRELCEKINIVVNDWIKCGNMQGDLIEINLERGFWVTEDIDVFACFIREILYRVGLLLVINNNTGSPFTWKELFEAASLVTKTRTNKKVSPNTLTRL